MPDDSPQKFNSYKDLKVWRQAMDIAQDIYQLAKTMAKKDPDLAAQLRYRASQIPVSLASGYQKKYQSQQAYTYMLRDTLGKLHSLDCMVILATELEAMTPNDELMDAIDHCSRMLMVMIKVVNPRNAQTKEAKVKKEN